MNHLQHIFTKYRSLKKWYDRFEIEKEPVRVQFT